MNEIKKLTKRTLLVTVCLIMILSPFYASPTTVQTTTAMSSPRYGGTLRVGYSKDPIGWNGIINYRSTTAYPARAMFNKIYTYDDLYNIVGDVMKGPPTITSEPGYPSVYTMEMERNIRWWDGTPMTAKDVVFTWETLTFGAQNKPGIPAAINDRLDMVAYMAGVILRNCEKIEMVDDYTVKFYFSEVQVPRWLAEYHSNFNIIPYHLWKDLNKHNPTGMTFEDNKYNDEPMGSGPYKLVEHVRDQYVIMERNEDYFRGVPYLENLVWVINPDPVSLTLALENGEIDTVHENSEFPLPEISRVNADPQFSVDAFPYTTTWRLTFNLHPDGIAMWPWLDDVNVRKAMEYAIDKETIVNEILFGITKPTYTAISWIVAPYGGDYNTPDQGYTGPWPITKRIYNPDTARQLLETAGWTLNAEGIRHKVIDGVDHIMSGFKMPYYAYATPWAEAITQYWAEVGISGEAVPLESTSYFEGIEVSEKGLLSPEVGGPYPVGLNTMGAGPDPDDPREWIEDRGEWGPGWSKGSDNFGFYYNERVNELLYQGVQTADYGVRKGLYDEMQYLINEDCAWIFLWNKWKTEAWNNDFAGFGSQRPIAWYGSYFRGNDSSTNIDRGVYWRGGTVEPFPQTTVLISIVTSVTTAVVPEFLDLRLLAALSLIVLTGALVYRRRNRIE